MSLLKSKSYGIDKDYLWSLRKHAVVAELGYAPPRSEVHSFKYFHERDCAEVFVSLALTGQLYDWQVHKRIAKDVIPDRQANLSGKLFYIEVERGTQDKIASKTESYRRYFQETRDEFYVLFLVPDEKTLESAVRTLEQINASGHYLVAVFSEFITDPMNALITDRFVSKTLSNTLSDRV